MEVSRNQNKAFMNMKFLEIEKCVIKNHNKEVQS